MEEDNAVSTVAELHRRIERSKAHIAPIRDCEHDDVVQILAMPGGDPRSFRREQKQVVRKIVSDIYSPPRVTEMLRGMTDHGMAPGLAMEIRVIDPLEGKPWDFSVKRERQRALRLIRKKNRWS